jgi:putative hydrolase of the HAD superfamily
MNLIFDADDTLWDSNIHFLEAEQAFGAAAGEAGVEAEPGQIAAMIRQCELEVIRTHGYGRKPYQIALERVALRLTGGKTIERQMRKVAASIGQNLIERHCELMPEVESTLFKLAKRHRLLLFTKGQRDEQLRKLNRSSLLSHFSAVVTPVEKNVASYRALVSSANLDRSTTYMIGNSPKSDINPALRAGLGAVFIAHPHTWVLEQEEIAPSKRLIVLSSFAGLREVF